KLEIERLFQEISILLPPFMTQFRMIFPFWIAGLALSALIAAYAGNGIERAAERLRRGRHPLLLIIAGCFLGIASPLCMYGTIPFIAMLSRKGIPQEMLTGFMVSSILLNPTLLVMTLILGMKIFIARVIMALAAGIIAGILVRFFFRGRRLFRTDAFDKEYKSSERTKFRQFLHSLRRNFEITAPYFLLGITLTVLMQRYIPVDIFTAVLGEKNRYAILASASIGVPLYMCGGGTIPLLRAWLQSGMGVGAACAFMISGPATKLNNLSAMKMVLGKFNFLLYLLYGMAFSLFAGYAADWLL
ncbi:MAG: permease, partial [Desulfobacterales bacterium]